MDRRDFLRYSLVAGGALALGKASGSLWSNWNDWKIQPLRRDLFLFTGRGGTILFLRNKSSLVVVDSQFPEQAGQLIAELEKTNTPPFDKLINTHHHGDHSGGNIAFRDKVKHVLAHKNSRANQEKQAAARGNEAAQYYPTQVFDDAWCEDVGREKICLHYFGPAHTNGDALVHFEKANVVHMGDLLALRRYPNIDRAAGASMENWMLVLDRAYNDFNRKTLFICGHGQDPHEVTANREFLREMKLFFESVFDHVKKQIQAGKTRDEIKAEKTVPGMEHWTDPAGFASVLFDTAYQELTAGS